MIRISKRVLGASTAAVALLVATASVAQTRQFNVPSEEAAKSIPEFARQAGVQITAPVSQLRGRRTPALVGQQDVRAALAKLLVGTGLEVASDNGATIVLRRSSTPASTGLQGQAEPSSNTSETASSFALDEIIVTAQKRAESAQNVPITLTAFGSEDLEKRNIQEITDLAAFTPGFVSSRFSYGTPIIAIRGADNTFSAAGATKPVGVFVDEIYIPRFSASNFSLFDVQSVSVLKGPQGTLFGRNVTGGAVLVQTREPSRDGLQANARVGAGNYGLYEASGYLSGPISETAAASLSIDRQKRDGYGRDILTGKEEDDADSWAGRAVLSFQPGGAFKLRLSGDYSKDENGGRAMSAMAGSDKDRRTSELGVAQTYDREIIGGSARMDFGEGPLKVTSLTGYRHSDSFEIFSRTGLSYRSLTSSFQEIGEEGERDSAFSQEARLNYESEAFNVVAGVFYFQEDSKRTLRKYRLAARTGVPSLDNLYDQKVKTTSAAPFADATWHVTDKFDLTGGLRYSYEEKDAQMRLSDRVVATRSFSGKAKHDWSEVTYRGVATYRPNRDVTLYASYATGFTAGGFNTEADLIAAFNKPFNPETSASAEIGLKSRFADGRGRFNLAAYSTQYKDKQEFVFNNVTFVGNITNATEAKSRGIEADVAFSPIRVLTLNATFGYADAKYGDYVIPGGATQTGNKLGKSPPYSYSLAADLDQPVSWGRILGNISFAYKDSYFPSASNTLPIPKTELVDGQIGIASSDDRRRLMVWGRNLTDQTYPLILSNFVVNAEWLAPPRTYGVRLSFKY